MPNVFFVAKFYGMALSKNSASHLHWGGFYGTNGGSQHPNFRCLKRTIERLAVLSNYIYQTCAASSGSKLMRESWLFDLLKVFALR